MKDNYLIIMAGGVGSRFWPMSKSSYPKQFHDVLGNGKTLLQLTAERFNKICPEENVFIVSNQKYKSIIEEQLPFLDNSQILLEPCMRNTAPCIAYAAYKINAKNPNAKLIIAPSDHLIIKQDAFEETIKNALKQTHKGDYLMTIGIKPHRPDTGYGYIQYKDGFEGINSSIKYINTFTEKPPKEKAIEFISSGDYYWNSGMFIWSVKSIIHSFKKHLPEIHRSFDAISKFYFTKNEATSINEIYHNCENISIDIGIMEKAENALVILADLVWSDLGTWGSLYEQIEKDTNENAIIADKIINYNSANNIIMVPKNKLVVTQGLNDFIVVENNNMLLICKKEDEQSIKEIVKAVGEKYGDEYI